MFDPHFEIKKKRTDLAFLEIEDVLCTEYEIPVLCDPSRTQIRQILETLVKNVEDDIFYMESTERNLMFEVFAIAKQVTPIYSGKDRDAREKGGEEMRSIIVQELNKIRL